MPNSTRFAPRVEESLRVLGDLLRGAGEGEPVERRRPLDRRIVLADDVQVHLDLALRVRAGQVAVLVDDAHGADDDPDVVVADPVAHQPHHVGVGAAADLHLVRDPAGQRRHARLPGADQQRHAVSLRHVLEARALARA